jgi:hypothetical protein
MIIAYGVTFFCRDWNEPNTRSSQAVFDRVRVITDYELLTVCHNALPTTNLRSIDLVQKRIHMHIKTNMCCYPIDNSITLTKMNTKEDEYNPVVPLSPSPVPTGKQVRFMDNVQVSSIPSPLELLESDEEWSAAWYKLEDLEVFRNEARDICRHMRLVLDTDEAQQQQADMEQRNHTAAAAPRTPSLARDTLTRGLEQRSCPERQRRKYLTSRFILKAATKLQSEDPVKLAALAHKCTAWATDLAIEEAARDYFRVVYGDDNDRVFAVPASNHHKKKRFASDAKNVQHRRVRSRPTLIQAL